VHYLNGISGTYVENEDGESYFVPHEQVYFDENNNAIHPDNGDQYGGQDGEIVYVDQDGNVIPNGQYYVEEQGYTDDHGNYYPPSNQYIEGQLYTDENGQQFTMAENGNAVYTEVYAEQTGYTDENGVYHDTTGQQDYTDENGVYYEDNGQQQQGYTDENGVYYEYDQQNDGYIDDNGNFITADQSYYQQDGQPYQEGEYIEGEIIQDENGNCYDANGNYLDPNQLQQY